MQLFKKKNKKWKQTKKTTYFYQTLVSCKPQELHLLSKNYQRSSKEQNKQNSSGAYLKHIENKLPTHAVLMGEDSPKPAPAVLNMIWGKHATQKPKIDEPAPGHRAAKLH